MTAEDETLTDRGPLAPLLAAGTALLLYVLAPLISIGWAWGLTNYDDPFVASTDNPVVADGLAGLWTVLTEPFMHAWLPLYYGSLGLDHALFGDWYFGWHLHSAVLWAICAALLVLVARELGLRGHAPLTAGIVLACHPAAIESVAWIASRKEQLSLLWSLVAVLAYLRGRSRGDWRWHLLGCAALAIALTAKASALVVPLLLAAHALLVVDGDRRQRLVPLIPYALVGLILALVHVLVAKSSETIGAGTGATLGELLYTDIEVVWMYARSLLLPWTGSLSVEHGVSPFAVDGRRVGLGVLLLIGLGVAAWMNRRHPWVLLTLVAVPLAAAPFNNVVPQTSVLFAERYLTFPIAVVALAAGALAARRLRGAAPFAAAVVLGLLASPRVADWRDAVSLWDSAARVAPESAFVRTQLADAHGEAALDGDDVGRAESLALARSTWEAARELARREVAHAIASRGSVPLASAVRKVQADTGLASHLLVSAGMARDGGVQLREVVALLDISERELADIREAPKSAERLAVVLSQRGTAREFLGDVDEALADWRRAAQLDQESWLAMNAVARIHLRSGRASEAIAALAASRMRAPDVPAAAGERARLRLAIGDPAGAKRELAGALAKHPDDANLLIATARLDLLLMRPLSAEEGFRRAMELRPDDEALKTELAGALIQQAQDLASRDDVEAARVAAQKAAEIAPGSSAPDQILGITARRRGDLDSAIRHFRAAHELQPEGVRIREALASVLAERAGALLREDREALAMVLLEEAVAGDADSIATPHTRLIRGVGGWPPLDPASEGRTIVARRAALAGLGYLAAGDPARALEELRVADAGADAGGPALERVTLELLARAALLTAQDSVAEDAASRLAGVANRLPSYGRHHAFDTQCATLTELGIARRGRGDTTGSDVAFAAARAALQEAETAGLPPARVALRRGEILFAEEEFLGATRAFDSAAELAPDDPEPLLDRAAVWRSLFALEGDSAFLDGSEEDLRRALSLAPSDGRIMAALGETLLLAQRASEAFPWLSRAVLADPSQRSARNQLSVLLVRAGRANLERRAETGDEAELDAAADAARRAVALDAPDPSPWTLLGEVRRAGGDWGGARAAFEEAVQRFPGRAEARDALAEFLRDLGHGYLLKGDEARAVESFREALAVEGTRDADLVSVNDRLHGVAVQAFSRGLTARAENRPADAVPAFRLSVRAEETPEGWFQLASALSEAAGEDDVGALREAAESFARAIAKAPDEPDLQPARLGRADVLARLGRPGEAAVEMTEWLSRAPEDDPLRRAVAKRRDVLERLEREIAEEVERRLREAGEKSE